MINTEQLKAVKKDLDSYFIKIHKGEDVDEFTEFKLLNKVYQSLITLLKEEN